MTIIIFNRYSFPHFCRMLKSVNSKTKINQLLEVNQPLVIDTLIKLNKNFSKLKSPVLRNLLARRVTIVDACKISGCAIAGFMESMKQIGFSVEGEEQSNTEQPPRPVSAIKEPNSYSELNPVSRVHPFLPHFSGLLFQVATINVCRHHFIIDHRCGVSGQCIRYIVS